MPESTGEFIQAPESHPQAQLLDSLVMKAGHEYAAILPILQGVNHAVSVGKDAPNMSEAHDKNNKKAVQELNRRYLLEQGMNLDDGFLMLTPGPGDFEIFAVTREDIQKAKNRPAEREDPETDVRASALVTDIPGVPLLCKPADCPVVIVHGKGRDGQQVLGMIHSGRNDTNNLISMKTISYMQREYGCKPEELMVGIAPSISMDNYYIRGEGENIINPEVWKGNLEKRLVDGKVQLHLNLLGTVVTQLTAAGVNPMHIQAYGEEVDTFRLAGENPPAAFSHRNGNKGRFLVAAQI